MAIPPNVSNSSYPSHQNWSSQANSTEPNQQSSLARIAEIKKIFNLEESSPNQAKFQASASTSKQTEGSEHHNPLADYKPVSPSSIKKLLELCPKNDKSELKVMLMQARDMTETAQKDIALVKAAKFALTRVSLESFLEIAMTIEDPALRLGIAPILTQSDQYGAILKKDFEPVSFMSYFKNPISWVKTLVKVGKTHEALKAALKIEDIPKKEAALVKVAHGFAFQAMPEECLATAQAISNSELRLQAIPKLYQSLLPPELISG